MDNYKATLRGSVVGMLLGDASVFKAERKSTHAVLQYRHSLKQEQYALWKASLLAEISRPSVTYGERVDPRLKSVTRWVNVKTRQHPFYTTLRERFYAPGHKVVDPFLLNQLDERGFAIWFFDDGTTKEYNTYIFTMCFSIPENHILSNYVWQRFGLHCRVTHYNGKPTLVIPAKSRPRLRELLEPYAHDAGMLYKIPNVHPPRGANLRRVKSQSDTASNGGVG